MPNDATSQLNVDLLLKHLKNGSLAARLVNAHRAPDAADPAEAMKAVLKKRLDQVKEKIDDPTA